MAIEMKKYALAYASKYGMAIIPLHNIENGKCTCIKGEKCGKSSGKHPRVSAWQSNWSKDLAKIEEWWSKWPDANIGMVTGKASGGICVVDIDEEIGRTNLARYVNGLQVPVAKTARVDFEGEHWYFKTDANIPDKIRGIDGLDFRNFGVIVLPPSQGLASRYKWKASIRDIEIPELPAEFIKDLIQVTPSHNESLQVTMSHGKSSQLVKDCDNGGSPTQACVTHEYIKGIYDLILNTICFEFKTEGSINTEGINTNIRAIGYKVKAYTLESPAIATDFFVPGCRERDLFSLANALVKAGSDMNFIRQVMTRVMFTCHDVDPSFIERKIKNAIKRHGETATELYQNCTTTAPPLYPVVPTVPNCTNLQPSVADRVREWQHYQKGSFSNRDCYIDLGLISNGDKVACRKTFGKLVEQGILEHVGTKAGYYRKCQKDMEVINWKDVQRGSFYDLKMPLGLGDKLGFYPKNIMIVAGAKSAGKTAWLMNMALLNNNKKVTYFNSEMAEYELADRIGEFGLPDSAWEHVQFVARSQDFHDVIDPTGFNIIDFLELHTNFYEVAGPIRSIHDKLTTGVAIIGLQKNKDVDEGRGGNFSKEKSRIYLALDFQRLKIVDCKYPKIKGTVMTGKEVHFKLINNGSTFIGAEAPAPARARTSYEII